MIFGVFERSAGAHIDKHRFLAAQNLQNRSGTESASRVAGNVALSHSPTYRTPSYTSTAVAVSSDNSVMVTVTGHISNFESLRRDRSLPAEVRSEADLILHLYRESGDAFLGKLKGTFAGAIWDAGKGRFLFFRDRLGIEPLYYFVDDERLVVSSSIPSIVKYLGVKPDIDFGGVSQFLLFNYNPGLQTVWQGVRKVRPAQIFDVSADRVSSEQYWTVNFSNPIQDNESTIAQEVFERMKNAVRDSLDPDENPGVFLSGGMDSSSVLGLIDSMRDEPVETFSYRCRGESFDESHYARMMADSVSAPQNLAEYGPDDVLRMPELMAEMNEPFCDVGINIATYLLGNAAGSNVSYVLTGDGGDELFAGHPIYEADKISRFIDPLPGLLKAPMLGLGNLLPDSDQKKNLSVKIKRFAESMRYPQELLSNRWRLYYDSNQLSGLLSRDRYSEISYDDLLADVLQFNSEVKDVDFLSHCLYGDYQTVVDFYLRRNELNRAFSLEARFPLLDYELVEYCARIPSNLKIKGWFDTKYIMKKAMEQLLPHGIVYREDKLGHSIPFKNWLRDDKSVREFVLSYASPDVVRKRGILEPSFVQQLLDQHMSKQQNNSHRIWAIAVLEMWMQHHID